MKSIIPLLIFSLSCLGCQKEDFDLESIAPEIIGVWTWDKTLIIENSIELDSLESKYVLDIDKSGKFRFFQDDLLIDVMLVSDAVITNESRTLFEEPYGYYRFNVDKISSFEDGSRKVLTFYFSNESNELVLVAKYPYSREQILDGPSADYKTPYNVYKRN